MALKLSLQVEDVTLISGGVVLMVDEIRKAEENADVTVAINTGIEVEFHELTMPVGEVFDVGDTKCKVMHVRRIEKTRELSVQFAFIAKPEVIIQRFHEFQSDKEMARILEKFDDKYALTATLAALDYYFESS